MANTDDIGPLLIAGGAFLILAKWAVESLPEIPIPDVIPEASKDFGRGIWQGEPDWAYIDQEGLSPNPPTERWWRDFGDLEVDQSPPISVIDGTAIPTPPVLKIPTVTRAEEFGINLRDAFTPTGAWERFKYDISFGLWGEDPNYVSPQEREVINAYQ